MSRLPTLRRSNQPEIRVEVVPRSALLRDSATQYAGVARQWATPRVEGAVGSTRARVDELTPRIATAVAAALLAAEPVRTEVLHRGTAAVAALKGDLQLPPPKRQRLRPGRRLMVLLAVVAGAGAGYKAWASKSSEDEWQNQWASTPSTTSTTTSSIGGSSTPVGTSPVTSLVTESGTPNLEPTQDFTGSSPDELRADADDESLGSDRTVTTPDNPADVTVIGDDGSTGKSTSY